MLNSKPLRYPVFITLLVATWATAHADLEYNKKHDEELQGMFPVEQVVTHSQYVCGSNTLTLSLSASKGDALSLKPTVSVKLSSGMDTFDVTKTFSRAVRNVDALEKSMSVQCNPDAGAFSIQFEPFWRSEDQSRTMIHIFSDGTVTGSRVR